MNQEADAVPETISLEEPSFNEPSDFEVDGSSSLSEVEENCIREVEQESYNNRVGLEDFTAARDNSRNISDVDNVSEAETECLEGSPTKNCRHQDNSLRPSQTLACNKVLLMQSGTLVPENNQGAEKNIISSRGTQIENSSSSSHNIIERGILSSPDPQKNITEESDVLIQNSNSGKRKRKRSIMGETKLQDLPEPMHKRTESILEFSDSSPAEDEANTEESIPNNIAKNICDNEGVVQQDDESLEDPEEFLDKIELNPEYMASSKISEKRNDTLKRSDSHEPAGQDDDSGNSMDQHIDKLKVTEKIRAKVVPSNEEEEEEEEEKEEEEEEEEEEEGTGIITRNEEATEKKRIALDRLSDIERQFSTFRERLYEERLKSLDQEDAMLREAQPSHPEYLAKLQCIDARRDEKIRKAIRLWEYELQSLKKVAVAQRSQILVQYQQEVREVREKKLEQLGEQWYKIQHDRRSYAGICPEYTLKFPTKRTQQISNQIAYNNEVSVLSGFAKYVGFPAAPIIAPASASELEDDLEKMGASPHTITKRSFTVT
ncbi:putative transcriptional regulatory protein dep1 protein [Golovinomyces cichoracearum]|uniref:Putative transcriptional regulatory protein dep1 protein n=1 Tax=Golovinomyces cichoracearum TaxID=62708 RepID=A0A420IJI9_9PEZI|nr:putative transcriptional regulatory protein dep1 protein [Golovinomyces cichoracearum]